MISFAFPAKTVVLKGDSNCALGEYIVEKNSDKFILDGIELETYTISYENSSTTIQVAVKQEEALCRYIVISDILSIQYVCSVDCFGTNKHSNTPQKQEMETDLDMLDSSAYYHQKIITRDKKSSKECLGLIACYYPKLVKDYENVFSCK